MPKYFVQPPMPNPNTMVDPLGELPRFISRRFRRIEKHEPEQFTYGHSYVNFMVDMVKWAHDERESALTHYAFNHDDDAVAKIQQVDSCIMLVSHPLFLTYVGLMTPEMWDMIPRRYHRCLADAYQFAKGRGMIR